MKIYIAGKITGDPKYWAKFAKAAEAIRQRGYAAKQIHSVLNPADLPDGMTPADYMRICFAMIDAADVCVFLPDWEESRGARLERTYCEYIGKKAETWCVFTNHNSEMLGRNLDATIAAKKKGDAGNGTTDI